MGRRTEPTTELGRRLDNYRIEQGWTVETMRRTLGVSKPTYLNWLRGSEPGAFNLFTIARVLDVEPCDVLEWVNPATVVDRATGR